MPATDTFKHWSSSFLDFIFPRNCIWRETPVETTSPFRYLGMEATRFLHVIEGATCTKCGAQLEGEAHRSHGCHHCLEDRFHFDRCSSAYRYNGPARALIQTLKYQDGLFLQEDIRRLLERHSEFTDNLAGAVLVPVPVSPRRLEKRGFNQAQLIVDSILRFRLPKTTTQPLLLRRDIKGSQTQLTRVERLKNVRRSFHLNPSALVDPEARYVIVDDVLTTGATVNACAETLKKAGAKQVEVATICRG